MLQLFPDGSGREVVLGTDILAGHEPQVVVPAGVWQGSLLEPGVEFVLLGATMAPGFEYADYEQGRRADLVARYPAHGEIASPAYTRELSSTQRSSSGGFTGVERELELMPARQRQAGRVEPADEARSHSFDAAG